MKAISGSAPREETSTGSPARPPPFKRYRHEPGNPNSLEKDEVTSVYEDSQGILWVGNRVALNRIDRKTGQYTIYRTAGGPGELSNTYVISIVEDRSGYLWFGTSGGGLNRFDRRTGQFKVYRHDPADPNSLSDDLVYSLFVDHEGTLWVGTDNGLDRFDPATESFHTYTGRGADSRAAIALSRKIGRPVVAGYGDGGPAPFRSGDRPIHDVPSLFSSRAACPPTGSTPSASIIRGSSGPAHRTG